MLFLAPGTYIRRFYLLPRNGKYSLPLRESCMASYPSLSFTPCLPASLPIYLPICFTPLIIPLAVVSFDYETKRGPRKPLSRAFVYLLDPRVCCTTPNGIAPSRRGRIARYNGPLHNGIRTCDIPGGHRVAAMLRARHRGVAKEFPSLQVRDLWGLHYVKFLM